ncbi:hypothetical protein [Natrialba sp. INN-245]|uniref:hypothetical protein n=1 Tax=Natrialba sp. INN-245 TaxID=2690967 RepID=UPI001310F708|nr:hypothetical protein [Natrialba sp. INN-245]MWV40118.1 hypothetical protein [Natrialba sp. INN-245]
MSSEQTDLEQAVRECVREHHDRGNSHVKTPHVAKELDVPAQRVSPYMGDMVREGALEVWRDSTNATVYRIHL